VRMSNHHHHHLTNSIITTICRHLAQASVFHVLRVPSVACDAPAVPPLLSLAVQPFPAFTCFRPVLRRSRVGANVAAARGG